MSAPLCILYTRTSIIAIDLPKPLKSSEYFISFNNFFALLLRSLKIVFHFIHDDAVDEESRPYNFTGRNRAINKSAIDRG